MSSPAQFVAAVSKCPDRQRPQATHVCVAFETNSLRDTRRSRPRDVQLWKVGSRSVRMGRGGERHIEWGGRGSRLGVWEYGEEGR